MLLRGPDAHSQRFLRDIEGISRRLSRAQRELSSGRRIHAPSDEPSQLTARLATRAELGQTSQSLSNLGRVKAETSTAEQALRHSVEAVDRAAVLASQGASSIADASTRNILALEADSLLQQLVGAAAVQVEGRYLFSGDADQTAPYSVDLSQANPVSGYQGSAATREVAHPSGTRFVIAHTAQEIFDSPVPGESVFQSLLALRTALRANDTGAIRTALGSIQTASVHLNNHLAAYGAIQNRVAEAIQYGNRQELSLKTRVSEAEDADLAAAAIELAQVQVFQQAAFQAEARRPRQSLFDYLG